MTWNSHNTMTSESGTPKSQSKIGMVLPSRSAQYGANITSDYAVPLDTTNAQAHPKKRAADDAESAWLPVGEV
jgi:hypothetical protein